MGAGAGATATAFLEAETFTISAVTITGYGGFVRPPRLVFYGGGGSGARATVSIDAAGDITGVTIVNAGSGYTETPTAVVIRGGGGPTAHDATVVVTTVTEFPDGVGLASIIMTDVGHDYTTAPTVTLTGGTPTTAATAESAIVESQNRAVIDVLMTNEGAGYVRAPTVTFTSGRARTRAATADAIWSGDPPESGVARIEITNQGELYTAQPTALISAGGGTGATLEVATPVQMSDTEDNIFRYADGAVDAQGDLLPNGPTAARGIRFYAASGHVHVIDAYGKAVFISSLLKNAQVYTRIRRILKSGTTSLRKTFEIML